MPLPSAVVIGLDAGTTSAKMVAVNAEGVIQAAREVKIDVPLVVRLAGTNVEAGKKILAESGLDLITADTLAEAARKAVDACAAAKTQH